MTPATHQASIEHVNMNVTDPVRATAMACAIFGWAERWRGAAADGGLTVHVGTETAYVAFHQAPAGQRGQRFGKGAPFNHIGIAVADLDAVEARVIAHGLTPFAHGDYAPGRRFYFFDPDGIEYEIVSYDAAPVKRPA